MISKNDEQRRRERIRKAVQNRNSSNSSSRFDTSDIIQETELQLWQSGHDNLDDDNSDVDQALLATMARGHLAKEIRKHHSAKRDASLDKPIPNNLVSDEKNPLETAVYQEQANLLLTALNRLDEVEREVILQRFFFGLTFVEIAEKLQLTRQQIQTRFEKAKRNLRIQMQSLRNPSP